MGLRLRNLKTHLQLHPLHPTRPLPQDLTAVGPSAQTHEAMRGILLSNHNRLLGAQAGTLSRSRIPSFSLHLKHTQKNDTSTSFSLLAFSSQFLLLSYAIYHYPGGSSGSCRCSACSQGQSLPAGSSDFLRVFQAQLRWQGKFSLVREMIKVTQIKNNQSTRSPEGRPQLRCGRFMVMLLYAGANSLKNLQ